MKLRDNLRAESEWSVMQQGVHPDRIIEAGSAYMVGNGYLGYRGTPCDWKKDYLVSCTVSDTWDTAPGYDISELCNVPNGLYTKVAVDGVECSSATTAGLEGLRLGLDIQNGIFSRFSSFQSEGISIREERFASLACLHALCSEIRVSCDRDVELEIITGIDQDVWSLHGEHFSKKLSFEAAGVIGINLTTSETQLPLCVAEVCRINGVDLTHTEVIENEGGIFHRLSFCLKKGELVTLSKFVVTMSGNDVVNPGEEAVSLVRSLAAAGYESCLAAHKEAWEALWREADIQIDGHLEDQILTRFNTYQSLIATPSHRELPVGARGLSCQVYQGAAFWDQEMFNMPSLAYTKPEWARNLLVYRYNTLDGARAKARSLGFEGAYYAWTSGKSGDELFPDFFFQDMFSQRMVRNHFNCWQIHVSPDIVFAIEKYVAISGDEAFLYRYGAEIIFEVAQFIVSRTCYRYDRDRAEILRVIGPDEYHENVDNNAYTNYISAYSLRKACELYDYLQESMEVRFAEIVERVGLTPRQRALWQEVSDKLYIPEPDGETGVIPQFDGYFKLEDVRPDDVRARLKHPEEYWGWPSGIAVNTQVIKQPDVVQLLALFDDFDAETIRKNYEYYEPRTEHGSSLSPSVHSLVASKCGLTEEAYRYFKECAGIDLYAKGKKKRSGSKFLGGIHTAASAAVWWVIVEGFAGLRIVDQKLELNPHVPKEWEAVRFPLCFRGARLYVSATHEEVKVGLHLEAIQAVSVTVFGRSEIVEPNCEVVWKRSSEVQQVPARVVGG